MLVISLTIPEWQKLRVRLMDWGDEVRHTNKSCPDSLVDAIYYAILVHEDLHKARVEDGGKLPMMTMNLEWAYVWWITLMRRWEMRQ